MLARARAEDGRRSRGGGTGTKADGPAAWGGILVLRAAVKSSSMYLLLWFKVIPWHCVEGGGGGGDSGSGNAMLVIAVVVMRGRMP